MSTIRQLNACALVALLCLTAPAAAQAPPSPAEHLGYELGARFTPAGEVVRYMRALAATSPLVEVQRYGVTPEGRELVQVVIASAAHRARLDGIVAAHRELSDPATPASRAAELARAHPALAYLSYGVHGNESSSAEAAMWTAWDLATGAANVAGVLDSLVVVIDPVLNPDGRDRYVTWYHQAAGATPNADPNAREHWEPWPGGRYNHYLFDLNRDWAWATQPETRARLATWERWHPVVHVDFHEMSYASSYFFFPAAAPINPLYPEHILKWGEYFGRANAAAFDERGWRYYTGESFDLFYPGYGDSWPSLVGAVGMTYEQAGHGRAGLAIERPDGDTLTLAQRAEHHRTSGAATLRAAAAQKTALLLDYASFHRDAARLPDILLVPGADATRLDALLDQLHRQGIRVERAAQAFRADARSHDGFAARREFPAGTYRVPGRQPRGRLAVTLLQPETVLDASYSYDVSAWSLPYAYGVEAHRVTRVPDAGWRPVGARPEADVAPAAARYGWLVPPGFGTWASVAQLLRDDGRAFVQDEPFTAAGRAWPAGTIFVPARDAETVQRLQASGLARHAQPVGSGFTEQGPDLGTEESYTLRLPRLAVITGDGVSPTSYGAAWFFLEQTLRLPFDAIPHDRLGAVQLTEYDVILVPDLERRDALPEARRETLKEWTQRGGTLIALGDAARHIAAPLAEIRIREEADSSAGAADRLERALRGRAARELERFEESIPGAILPLRLDPAHPLAFGAGAGGDSVLFVLHTGRAVFEPDTTFETAAYFPADLQKTSGVISRRNLDRLSQSAWLANKRFGRGRVILFADDPLFRHFWYSGFQLLANSIFLGPAL